MLAVVIVVVAIALAFVVVVLVVVCSWLSICWCAWPLKWAL